MPHINLMLENKILFLGFAVSDEVMINLCSKDAFPQVAAQKLQWNIINGIEETVKSPIQILSAIPASNYPLNNKLFFGFQKWCHKEKSNDFLIPFCNVILLKHLTRLVSAVILLSRWHLKNKQSKRHILIYAMHSPFVSAAIITARLFGGRITLIVPDLPEFMDVAMKKSYVRRIFKYIDSKLQRLLISHIHGLIVVTQQISDSINKDNLPHIVIEGIIDDNIDSEVLDVNCKYGFIFDKQYITIMYAGGLAENYGIKLLLDAFNLITVRNFRLIICGKGEMENEVNLAAKKDSRIIFLGQLLNTDIVYLEKRVSLLINVRPSDNQFTKYSFPSKILEYLLSGRPILTTKLDGIPDEYYSYLYLLDNEDPNELSKTIQNICLKPVKELDDFGRAAREFVTTYKNYRVQGRRIVEFMLNTKNNEKKRN